MDLVVSEICVHEAEELVTRGGIHELVNPWDWEGVFWACFVKICVVNADPSFPFQLLDCYYIGEPFRIVNFPYKLGHEWFFQLPR